MPKKYTYEQVSGIFENAGCKLLSEDYKNNKTPLNYICVCGNEGSTRLKNFLIGQRCVACGLEKRRTLNLQEVKAIFEKEEYELLDSSYTSCVQKLKYRCPKGHIGTTTVVNFTRGHRCKACGLSGESNPRWNPDRNEVRFNEMFRKKCYNLLYRSLYATNNSKTSPTKDLLGYDSKELKEHVEQHPDWPQLKKSEWHLDHVFPIKAFIDHGITDMRIINCLENLRPCKAVTNLKKQGSYNKEEFEQWLREWTKNRKECSSRML